MVIIAVIAGTTQGLTAYLLGSSYAVALGLIAGFLDMIPNIGATIGGFVLSLDEPADREQRPHTDDPAQGRQAVGVLHHRRRRALRRPARGGPALIAVPVAATIQIVLREVTKTYRAQVAAGKLEAGTAPVGEDTRA